MRNFITNITMMSSFDLNSFIDRCVQEDVGDGDHSSLACIPADHVGKAQLLVKQDGIIAGLSFVAPIFHYFDPATKIEMLINDGSPIKVGDIAFRVEAKEQVLLKAERLILNILQRMSGIATHTHELTEIIKGTKTRLLDTRKTTPGFRYFEKAAVKLGGGENHRFGLYDMIMLKDNHVDFAGGIQPAIQKTKAYLKEKGKNLKIELEVRDFKELEEALQEGGIHRIMLDNFSPADLSKAIQMIDGKYETEASGGITKETIRSYAETGVDFISVGALTHQIQSLDLSLKAI